MGNFCCCKKKQLDTKPELDQTLFNNNDVMTNNNSLYNDISISVNESVQNDNAGNNLGKSDNEEIKEKIEDSNTIYSERGLNLNEKIGDDEPLLKADSPLICEYEKNVITFTKNGLIKLFDEYMNLDGFQSIWNKNNLSIEIRYEGTPMNNKFYLVKGIYKLKKSDLKYNNDIDSIVHFCYDMNFRMMWDEAIKSVEKYEGNDYSYIVCTWGKSPVFFVSERETIEKRFLFKKGDIIYIMSTSIPLEIFEQKKDVVRFIDFLNLVKVYEEGEYIIFASLNQVDFKMPIPQMLINITLPSTSTSWYANYVKFANSIKYDKETKKYERIEED
jgi:hypothetical protein